MSPLNDLFERRVPQWTAVYIGAGWGLVQFIAFIEERYLISPHWTDLALLSLGLLLPSVVLFTYNHGRPGADVMRRSEKVGIPANLVVAAIVLWLVFGKKDLGAMTTEVSVTGENGETIERELAKPEHRRRLALFTPEAPRSDTAATGLVAGLGLQFDLSQDTWIDLRAAQHFMARLGEAGYEPHQPTPLSLKREVADQLNLTHFTSSRVDQTANGYRLTIALYDVARGRKISERSYEGAELLPLVDSASHALRVDLEIPTAHLDEVEDLPVVERLSANPAAVRAYAHGWDATLRNDWAAASGLLARAVELDPTFAAAGGALFQSRLYTGDYQGAVAALNQAVSHMYRLPERMQFYLRAGQYQMRQQSDRAIGVLEMAAELYPDDIEPRALLAILLQQADRERDAITRLEEVLRLDPGQVEHLLSIGTLHEGLGEYDSALAAYERYVEAAPSQARGPLAIGAVKALLGEHDEARRQYERALMLESTNVDVMIAAASLARETGDFAEARAQLAAAEAAARTPEGRHKVAESRAELSRWLGRPMESHAHLSRSIDYAAEFTPPMLLQIYRMSGLKVLAEAGQADRATRELAAIAPAITGIFADVTALGALSIESGRSDPDVARIDAEADRLERFLSANAWEMLQPAVLNARGHAAELRGQYGEAVRFYRRQIELDPSRSSAYTDLGRALRLSGDLNGAARELASALRRRPADAKARYELGLVHRQAGRSEEALAEIRRAVAIWEQAEPAYMPAAKARATLDQLLSARPVAG